MAHEEMQITRRDIAKSEIEASIDLLRKWNVVAAHVLAFSAKAILRGVAKAEGIETIDDRFEDYIKDEFVKDWRKRLYDDYNVFKHSNEDPTKKLETFRPESTAIAIFTTVVNYQVIYKAWSLPMAIYYAWFLSRHPSWAKGELIKALESWKTAFPGAADKPLQESIATANEFFHMANEYPHLVAERIPQTAAIKLEL